MTKWDYVKLGGFVIALSLMLYWRSYVGSSDWQRERKKDYIEESYSGIVARKYIDTYEHNRPMLQFRDSMKIAMFCDDMFWDSLKVGDSVVKENGSAYIFLYRKEKLKEKFDYNRYFDGLIEASNR